MEEGGRKEGRERLEGGGGRERERVVVRATYKPGDRP